MEWQVNEEKAWFKYWPKNCPRNLQFRDMTAGDFFEIQRQKYPNEIFMWFLKSQITYDEAGDYINVLGTAFFHLGLQPGDVIALLMPNCPQFVISYFACLKVGITVTAINPTLRQNEILHHLKVTNPTAIITIDALWEETVRPVIYKTDVELLIHSNIGDLIRKKRKVKKEYGKIPKVDVDFPRSIHFMDLLKAEEYLPDVDIDPRKDTAVYTLTGGTMGTPKVIALTHYNIIANAIQLMNWLGGEDPGTGFIGAIPLFHPFGMTGVMNASIALGGWMMLFPTPPETGELLAEIDDIYSPNGFVFVGPEVFFKRIVDSPVLDDFPNIWNQMKYCISAANPLESSIKELFERQLGGQLVQSYGLTEAGPIVSVGNLIDKSPLNCLGVPLPATDWAIFNPEDFRNGPIADGLPESKFGKENVGELCISGPQVMKEYVRNIDDTKAALRSYGGKIWLLTGDLGYMTEDGMVVLVARKEIDRKGAGEAAFLVDIEAMIMKHKAVLDVAVFGFPPEGEKRGVIMKIWVTLKPMFVGKVTENQLKSWIDKSFYNWRVLADIEFVGKLPKAVLGKVQKRTPGSISKTKLDK